MHRSWLIIALLVVQTGTSDGNKLIKREGLEARNANSDVPAKEEPPKRTRFKRQEQTSEFETKPDGTVLEHVYAVNSDGSRGPLLKTKGKAPGTKTVEEVPAPEQTTGGDDGSTMVDEDTTNPDGSVTTKTYKVKPDGTRQLVAQKTRGKNKPKGSDDAGDGPGPGSGGAPGGDSGPGGQGGPGDPGGDGAGGPGTMPGGAGGPGPEDNLVKEEVTNPDGTVTVNTYKVMPDGSKRLVARKVKGQNVSDVTSDPNGSASGSAVKKPGVTTSTEAPTTPPPEETWSEVTEDEPQPDGSVVSRTFAVSSTGKKKLKRVKTKQAEEEAEEEAQEPAQDVGRQGRKKIRRGVRRGGEDVYEDSDEDADEDFDYEHFPDMEGTPAPSDPGQNSGLVMESMTTEGLLMEAMTEAATTTVATTTVATPTEATTTAPDGTTTVAPIPPPSPSTVAPPAADSPTVAPLATEPPTTAPPVAGPPTAPPPPPPPTPVAPPTRAAPAPPGKLDRNGPYIITPPTIVVTKPTIRPLRTKVVVVHSNHVPVPVDCMAEPNPGTCARDMIRIYYDHRTRSCKPFAYSGCGGNDNRFLSVKNCYRVCHPYRYHLKPVKVMPRATSTKRPEPIKYVPYSPPRPPPTPVPIKRQQLESRQNVIDRETLMMLLNYNKGGCGCQSSCCSGCSCGCSC